MLTFINTKMNGKNKMEMQCKNCSNTILNETSLRRNGQILCKCPICDTEDFYDDPNPVSSSDVSTPTRTEIRSEHMILSEDPSLEEINEKLSNIQIKLIQIKSEDKSKILLLKKYLFNTFFLEVFNKFKTMSDFTEEEKELLVKILFKYILFSCLENSREQEVEKLYKVFYDDKYDDKFIRFFKSTDKEFVEKFFKKLSEDDPLKFWFLLEKSFAYERLFKGEPENFLGFIFHIKNHINYLKNEIFPMPDIDSSEVDRFLSKFLR